MNHLDKHNAISRKELTVLKCLEDNTVEASIELTQISVSTGIRDRDEVLRALYTLEGKNLAQPSPEGDLTSNQWKITNDGVRALRLFANG